MATMTAHLTPRQTEVLELLERIGKAHSRRVAGELGTRAQDAGRTLESLRRLGLVEENYDGGCFGYRPMR